MPSPANMTKARRQLTYRSTKTTSTGVNAPPQRAKVHMMPCALACSTGGSQVENALVRLGKQPASPTPNRKRVIHIVVKLRIAPVSAVNADHHSTIRIRTLRGPIQ